MNEDKSTEALPTKEELAEVRILREERAEKDRTKGKYCLTEEGRSEIRRIWGDEPDHWIVCLLDEVERLEDARASAASQGELPSLAKPPVADLSLREIQNLRIWASGYARCCLAAQAAEIEDWRGRLASQCGKTLAQAAEMERLRGNVKYWHDKTHELYQQLAKADLKAEAALKESQK